MSQYHDHRILKGINEIYGSHPLDQAGKDEIAAAKEKAQQEYSADTMNLINESIGGPIAPGTVEEESVDLGQAQMPRVREA